MNESNCDYYFLEINNHQNINFNFLIFDLSSIHILCIRLCLSMNLHLTNLTKPFNLGLKTFLTKFDACQLGNFFSFYSFLTFNLKTISLIFPKFFSFHFFYFLKKFMIKLTKTYKHFILFLTMIHHYLETYLIPMI